MVASARGDCFPPQTILSVVTLGLVTIGGRLGTQCLARYTIGATGIIRLHYCGARTAYNVLPRGRRTRYEPDWGPRNVHRVLAYSRIKWHGHDI